MFQGNVLVWNCRGIVNFESQRALIDIVQARKPSLIFLAETLAQKEHIDALTRRLGFKDNIYYPQERESQGVALIWNDDTHASLRSRSPNHIDVVVGKPDETHKWRFTVIYGVVAHGERHRTWTLIQALAAEPCTLPWLMAGDFNKIMSNNDKSGGPRRAAAPMATFRRTMADCDLLDMGFVGSRFTWSNKYTKERLDRSFQTPPWRSLFPYNRVITLNPSESDHCPLLIIVSAEKLRYKKATNQFRFEECWHENPRCGN
ncbi:uncharacterized protein LOC112184050 [Rosa chinensis]|uniref:uncharacterized protein LOC112184050 n=1 Tax=Rosa chinensis TaxID=74649 RepID=UPI000D0969A0|nr:uncharacterized protein LOC112184050 [Rosa chinensis]